MDWELEEKVKADQQEVDTYEQNMSDFDSFSAIIRKYVGIKELTPAIVNEFTKKIIVHAPEKADGKRVQKVDIVFNFVGEINFFLPRNRNGKAHKENALVERKKSRYSPYDWGYTGFSEITSL